MLEFTHLKQQQLKHINNLLKDVDALYHVDEDKLWSIYINSFPEKNGIRQSFNCNNCRWFIKQYGNLVAIKDNKLISIWSFQIEDELYQQIIDNLRDLVLSKPIKDKAYFESSKIGLDFNYANDGTKWNHFYFNLNDTKLFNSITRRNNWPTLQNQIRTNKKVFKRSLDELSISATRIVLQLIEDNSLYRGAEYKPLLITFLKYQECYQQLNENEKDNFCWVNSKSDAIAHIRNSAIGTLLSDLSNGVDEEVAVRKYEAVVAPSNYKRPKPIVTERMINDAEKTIIELGYAESLNRRIAVLDDLDVNDVLFINRHKTPSTLLSSLKKDVIVKPADLGCVKSIGVNYFLSEILPNVVDVQFLLENHQTNNLVSLIAPVNPNAPNLLKWNNRFSWCYNNNYTDSIKEQVREAGGNVNGYLRISLSWNTTSDLDLHLYQPKDIVSFRDKRSIYTNAELDVDMNAGSILTTKAVENIIFPSKEKMMEGEYTVKVNNYKNRETTNTFTVEVEVNGEISQYVYRNIINNSETIDVVKFKYNKETGIMWIPVTPENKLTRNKTIWNINTLQFHKVTSILYSPNYWNDNAIGNKHLFFILDNCINTSNDIRGIFNEFLKDELVKNHKRVFELLGGNFNVEKSTSSQLSGIGFSLTKSDYFHVKITTNTGRTEIVKVTV